MTVKVRNFEHLVIAICLSHSVSLYGQNKTLGTEEAKVDSVKINNLLSHLSIETCIKDPGVSLSIASEALTLSKKINFKKGEASAYYWLGKVKDVNGNDSDAIAYFLKSLQFKEEIKDTSGIEKVLLAISGIYYRQGNFENAKDYSFRASLVRKDIYDANIKRQAVAIALSEAERKTQKIIIGFVIFILFLVIIFSFLIFNRLRITRNQKNIIEKQNIILAEKKKLVEEKNKEILDSIHYAKRIQRSLLPTEKYIARSLNHYKK